jgi:gag-polypeptide of LTR copia-type
MVKNLAISMSRADQPIQFSHQIHTVLTHENYLLCKSQILSVLRGYNLVGFIDGTSTMPPSTILVNEISTVNPAFTKWHQRDQLILAWLFSSISAPILAQVLHAETSFQLWQHLNQFHTSQSLAKVLELKLLLQTSKKSNLTCTQFIQHMQSLADRLRSVGSMITYQDLVIYTLQGLNSEYEACHCFLYASSFALNV